ncbi:hypothetical protein [Cellulomonas phragmiteti]|uniref:Lipoprotein n=1 Tax=Cellulomonas phragmiteti TaxID=478780 RepID=A0ABQ4DIX1_9CELL|nr:hypothetical protein [Cellulomonas phragmiteti]GIG39283.1 hypothetical protein Cph01nite_10450 [Cellulomonas phragmiteti]
MRIRTSRTALLVGASALVLAACTGGEGDATPPPVAATTEPAPDPSPDAGASDDDAMQDDMSGLPPRPQRDSCVDIPVPDDGIYTVYDAGTAVVTFEDGALVLGEVTAADGWTARVDDQDADEVEIDFRRSADEVLDLEVEVDDGRVEAQICHDDD